MEKPSPRYGRDVTLANIPQVLHAGWGSAGGNRAGCPGAELKIAGASCRYSIVIYIIHTYFAHINWCLPGVSLDLPDRASLAAGTLTGEMHGQAWSVDIAPFPGDFVNLRAAQFWTPQINEPLFEPLVPS
ncbi:MAG: hypothetical protein ACT4O2_12575 [Beijerinckiaceae bacterium]